MSTPLSEMFLDSLLRFVQKNGADTAVKIVDFDEETEQSGYCPSCYYSETIVEITWEDAQGKRGVTKYSGSFVRLLNELIKEG